MRAFTTEQESGVRLFVKKEKQGSGRMTFLHKKVEAKRTLLRRGRGDRMHIALQSALLGDPNAWHFGTRLHTTRLKTIINRFLNASCLLKVQILSIK